jgi:hypothetical protein
VLPDEAGPLLPEQWLDEPVSLFGGLGVSMVLDNGVRVEVAAGSAPPTLSQVMVVLNRRAPVGSRSAPGCRCISPPVHPTCSSRSGHKEPKKAPEQP